MTEQAGRRRSIRLRGHDYSSPGAYFVTVCTRGKECIFGKVRDGKMELNPFGIMVHDAWRETALIRPNVELDEFIVMPNHFHAIVHIACRGVLQYAPTDDAPTPGNVPPPGNGSMLRSPSQTIGSIVRGFKSMSAGRINEFRNMPGMIIWQRNYHEHIVRCDDELARIREYIASNPARWDRDPENPVANKLP